VALQGQVRAKVVEGEPALVLFHPPQVPHGLACGGTWTVTVKGQQLTS
jgi:hypothetical protein